MTRYGPKGLSTAAGYITRNRREIVPAAGAGAIAAGLGATDSHHKTRNAAGGLAGAGAAQAGWYRYGMNLKAQGHAQEKKLPPGMSRSKRTKLLKDHRKLFDLKQGELPSGERGARYFRNYPAELPGSGIKRRLGRISGRQGLRRSAYVTLAGGGAGLALTRSHTHNPSTVGKALYGREEHISPLRAAEATIGVAGLAWGAPRLRMIGPALRRGAKSAGDKDVRRALTSIEQGRSWLESATEGPGRRFAASRVGHGVAGLVPPRLIAETAAVGGALTLNHAVPVRRSNFTPVQGGY